MQKFHFRALVVSSTVSLNRERHYGLKTKLQHKNFNESVMLFAKNKSKQHTRLFFKKKHGHDVIDIADPSSIEDTCYI